MLRGMNPADASTDERALLDHVHSIFRAYLAKDRAAIRATHCGDWIGFQVRSRGLVRGIDAYMSTAEDVLAALDAVSYDMLDTHVEVHGDLGLVYYLARDRMADGSTVLLRALDVYRREPGGWNQCGSHVSALPEASASAR